MSIFLIIHMKKLWKNLKNIAKEGKEKKGYFPVIVTVDETLLESLSFNISDNEEFNRRCKRL